MPRAVPIRVVVLRADVHRQLLGGDPTPGGGALRRALQPAGERALGVDPLPPSAGRQPVDDEPARAAEAGPRDPADGAQDQRDGARADEQAERQAEPEPPMAAEYAAPAYARIGRAAEMRP